MPAGERSLDQGFPVALLWECMSRIGWHDAPPHAVHRRPGLTSRQPLFGSHPDQVQVSVEPALDWDDEIEQLRAGVGRLKEVRQWGAAVCRRVVGPHASCPLVPAEPVCLRPLAGLKCHPGGEHLDKASHGRAGAWELGRSAGGGVGCWRRTSARQAAVRGADAACRVMAPPRTRLCTGASAGHVGAGVEAGLAPAAEGHGTEQVQPRPVRVPVCLCHDPHGLLLEQGVQAPDLDILREPDSFH